MKTMPRRRCWSRDVPTSRLQTDPDGAHSAKIRGTSRLWWSMATKEGATHPSDLLRTVLSGNAVNFHGVKLNSRGRSPLKRFPPCGLSGRKAYANAERTPPIAMIDQGDQFRLRTKNNNPPTKIALHPRVMSRSSLITRPIDVSL